MVGDDDIGTPSAFLTIVMADFNGRQMSILTVLSSTPDLSHISPPRLANIGENTAPNTNTINVFILFEIILTHPSNQPPRSINIGRLELLPVHN